MKNIHVLPTEKLSRLQKFIDYHKGRVEFELCRKDEFFNKGQHIYITSDEEIKEGDFRLNIQRGYLKKSDKEGLKYYNKRNDVFKKIILTTDQDLIKDGVQAIDDYFLEWFVKNPSCEDVKVELQIGSLRWSDSKNSYKIIIPKEETKQRLEKYSERFDNDKSAIGNPNTWGKRIVEKPKQETLEEVGMYQQELFNYLHDLGIIALQSEMQEIERIVLSMQQQDKKMYSEEEVYIILEKFRNLPLIQFQEWFEQFKNK